MSFGTSDGSYKSNMRKAVVPMNTQEFEALLGAASPYAKSKNSKETSFEFACLTDFMVMVCPRPAPCHRMHAMTRPTQRTPNVFVANNTDVPWCVRSYLHTARH